MLTRLPSLKVVPVKRNYYGKQRREGPRQNIFLHLRKINIIQLTTPIKSSRKSSLTIREGFIMIIYRQSNVFVFTFFFAKITRIFLPLASSFVRNI